MYLSVNKLSLVCLPLSDWSVLVAARLSLAGADRIPASNQNLSQSVRVRCACV